MFLLIIISLMVILNSVFLVGFFRSEKTEDKILFQTTPSLLFWTAVILSSVIGNAIFSSADLVAFGYDIVILGAIISFIPTFIMGVFGCIASLKKRNTPYMIFSILSILIIVLPVALVVFPFVSIYLIIKKQERKKKAKRLAKQKKKQIKKQLKKQAKKK